MKKIVIIFLFIIIWANSKAQVVVTPGVFPTMCQGGTKVKQTSPIIIAETNVTDFSVSTGSYVFRLPAGYVFDNWGAGTYLPYVSVSSDVTLLGATGGPDFLVVTFSCLSTLYKDTIKLDGFEIRALDTAPATAQMFRDAKNNIPPGYLLYPVPADWVQNGNMPVNNQNHATLNSVSNPAPTVTFVPESFYCNRENVNHNLTSSPLGGTWSGQGVSGNNFNAYLVTAGTKRLFYTVINNVVCTNRDSVDVLIKTSPIVSIASNDVDNIICGGQSVTFTGTSTGINKRFQFFKNDIPVTSLSATATYSSTTLVDGDQIKVIADNGNLTCPDTSLVITMTVVPNPNPTISILGLPALICSNNTTAYAISTSPLGGVLAGLGVVGNNFIPSLAGAGNHSITYSINSGSCTFIASTSANVIQAPSVILTSSDANNIICEGDAVTFTANTSGTANRYLFLKNTNGIQGPNGTSTFVTSSLIDGDEISVTVDNGAATCPSTATGIITTVGKIPKASFSWSSACGQNEVTFHDLSSVAGASTLTTWEWDYTNDAVIDYTQLSATPDVVFTYPSTNEYNAKLTVTTDKGCLKDTVIRVYTLPGKTPTPTDPYAINFENSNQGWAYDGTNSSWGWGLAPTEFNATRNIWSTGQNSGDGKYSLNEKSYLYGPCINLSQLEKPMIGIKLSSKIVDKPAGAILEVTTDEGLNWVKLGNVNEGLNWYNVQGIVSTPFTFLANSTNNNPLAQGWADNINFDNSNISKISLQQFSGNTSVRFRINFTSVANGAAPRYAGIGIDSVWIGNRTKFTVLEHFSSIDNRCVDCITANEKISDVASERQKDVIPLFYHTSFPYSDAYNQFNSGDVSSRVLLRGISNSPTTYYESPGRKADYKIGSPNLDIDTIDIDKRTLITPVFKIELTTNMSISGKIDISSRITYTGNTLFASDIILHFVVIEDTTDGNTNYNWTVRKMLPIDAAGEYISRTWIKGESVIYSSTWDHLLTGNRKFSVVAFIETTSSNPTILQAAFQRGTGSSGTFVPTSVNSPLISNGDFIVFPNPTSSEINIIYNNIETEKIKWELINTFGIVIKSGIIENKEEKIAIDAISSGIYILKLIDSNNSSISKKIIIQH